MRVKRKRQTLKQSIKKVQEIVLNIITEKEVLKRLEQQGKIWQLKNQK